MRTPRIRLRWVALSAGGLVLGGVAAIGLALWGNGDSASSVALQDGDVVVSQGSPEETLREASRIAGFQLKAPGHLPDGYELAAVLIHPAPEGLPGLGAPSDERIVSLSFKGPSPFQMDQLRDGFDPQLSGQKLDGAVAGAEVWADTTDTSRIYSVLADGRGYIFLFNKDSTLNESEILDMVRSTLSG